MTAAIAIILSVAALVGDAFILRAQLRSKRALDEWEARLQWSDVLSQPERRS